MTGKNVLYAAVGAPVVAARRVAEAVSELRSTLNKEADTVGKTANKRVALWADEGEKLVNRITDAKMVDELTSKVDFEQVSNQVSKLRDQLEDMLATWRSSFRPEKLPTIQMEASVDGVKIETKSPVARKATAQKSPTKKSVAKKSSPSHRPRRNPVRRAVQPEGGSQEGPRQGQDGRRQGSFHPEGFGPEGCDQAKRHPQGQLHRPQASHDRQLNR